MVLKHAVTLLAFAAMLSGCSGQKGNAENRTAEQSNAPTGEAASKQDTVKSAEGRAYKVERTASIKSSDLPVNSDFKMADRDIAKYAQTICMLDVGSKGTPVERCDVYAQPDKEGTIIGYAAVIRDSSGVRLETNLELNQKKVGSRSTSCGISGYLYSMDGEWLKDSAKDFTSQISYSAWEKSPGDWLVSTDRPDSPLDDNPDAASGTWYVKRLGDKLQINQERWNYCYPNKSDIYIDDIFYRVLTLTSAKETM